MPRSLQEYLQDIVDHSIDCQRLIEGKTPLMFANDLRLRRAVERQIQIVGEALWQSSKLMSSLSLHISDVHKITGLRHKLVHDYWRIASTIVWSSAQDYLPTLRQQILRLLERLEIEDEADD